MTKLFDHAVSTVSELPAEMQDEVARIMLSFVNENEEIYVLSPEEEADIDEALAEVERGELATDEEVRSVLAKYRL
jgi:predicted transcriptional regulator